ncbi:hypothetical protein FRC12_019534 [Ceratobasidium sp. 428]|nr:hypothetical protein FRC12_019534 [Ceratobasidium sp. 428]
MPNNPAHSPPVVSTSLSDINTTLTSRDSAAEAAEATAASLTESGSPGLGSSSVRTRRSAHSSVSARSSTPYQRNKRARTTSDTDPQDESLSELPSRRKTSRRDNAPPSATTSSQSQLNELVDMDLGNPDAFESEASERPTPPMAPIHDHQSSLPPSGNHLFATLTSAIKSLADKPNSEYHEDGFLAVPALARSIFAQFATSTSNAGNFHDPAYVSQMKTSLIAAAEDFVRELKLVDSPPGLSSSIHAPPSDPLYALLEEVRELKHTQEKISNRLNSLEGSHGPKRAHFTAPHTPSTPNSYAQAVSGSQAQELAPPRPPRVPVAVPTPVPSGKTKLLPAIDNVRIVVRCSRHPRSADSNTRLPARSIAERINTAIAKASPNPPPKLIGVNWNRSNNIILTFPPNTSVPSTIDLLKRSGVLKALDFPPDTPLSADVPWSKIMITHVPTGFGEEAGVFPDHQVVQSFLESNEWAKKLRFGQQPRWLKRPDTINKPLSSVVLSFEDPDGSIIREVLRKPVFMFSTLVRTKRWEDKPLLQGCSRCLALDHKAPTCKRKVRCDQCAGDHSTESHRIACKACRRDNTAAGAPCPHPLRCANCKGSHCASNTSCPERSKFRTPSASPATSSADPSVEDMQLA